MIDYFCCAGIAHAQAAGIFLRAFRAVKAKRVLDGCD